MTARNRRRGGRGPNKTANAGVAPPDPFNDRWLRQFSERQYLFYADLSSLEDRRRFHPDKLSGMRIGPAPRALVGRPRIVIVPEGHRLARYAPWGARKKLRDVIDDRGVRWRVPGGTEYSDYYNSEYDPRDISRRVGFQHPWQVMICVRRRRRREVIFAFGKAGSGKRKQNKPRRNFWSEVRC